MCVFPRSGVNFLAVMQRKETTMLETPAENGGAIHVRLRGSLFERLEDWRLAQEKIPARSGAIRELLQRALDTEQRRAFKLIAGHEPTNVDSDNMKGC